MDETTDAVMETDVSSTTEDVSEMQEVTGSHGNVEMVVVVEKLDEEWTESVEASKSTEKSSYQINQDYVENEVIQSSERKDCIDNDSAPIVSARLSKSNHLLSDNEVGTSPNKDNISQNPDLDLPVVINNSSMKQTSPQKLMQNLPPKLSITPPKTIQNNPLKPSSPQTILTTQKSLQNTPQKPLSPQKILPPQISLQNNLHKPLPQKTVENGPSKLLLTQKSNEDCVPMQVALVKAIQNSDIKQISLPKTIQSSPLKHDNVELSVQNVIKLVSPVKLLISSPKKISPEKITDSEPNKSIVTSVIPLEFTDKTITEDKTSNKLNTNEDQNTANELSKVPTPEPISSAKESVPQQSLDMESVVDSLDGSKSVEHSSIDDEQNVVETPNVTAFVEKEVSSDTHLESNSDISDKERGHEKNIGREMRSLINSARESKIISECTQITSKIRKSRSALDNSNSSFNSSLESEKIQGVRRSSNNSQRSNSSEKSDVTLKRLMRSQNPEFMSKVKSFLNSVSGKNSKSESDCGNLSDQELDDIDNKEKETRNAVKNKDQHNLNQTTSSPPKKKKTPESPVKSIKLRSDSYCWRCHWAVEPAASEKTSAPPVRCTVCPRSFHYKCLTGTERNKAINKTTWVCPECMLILHAESSETRSHAMKKMSVRLLSELLNYALQRMMEINGVEPFLNPVDRTVFPDYDKYVVHPMHLTVMKENIEKNVYGSTEAFLADAQWIHHNSIIFNTMQSKLTAAARALVRACKTEMCEIEACPECYAGAHARPSIWFTDVCSTPHMLLWAKLKGFPYWPAKAMSVNSSGMVDVRFFGAHDRAWVPAKDCFLYSEKDPNNFRTKRQDIIDSMQEAEEHIRNLSRRYGRFVYPPFKTQFEPTKLTEQLKMMIPSFEGEVTSPTTKASSDSSPRKVDKSRSNSKCSKDSIHDGDMSESEDAIPRRKMADGAEIARDEEYISVDKDNTMQVDKEISRKRRRSESDDSVDSSKVKRKRLEEEKSDELKHEVPHTKAEKLKEKSKVNEKSNGKKETKVAEITLNDESTKTAALLTTSAKSTPISKSTPKGTNDNDMPNETKATTKSVSPKVYKAKISKTPKIRLSGDKDSLIKIISLKSKQSKEKSSSQNENSKIQKQRRNSKNNMSLLINNVKDTQKKDGFEVYSENSKPQENIDKKETTSNNNTQKTKVDKEKNCSLTSKLTKPVKERIQFDDDTSLAVLARKCAKTAMDTKTVLPTISSVRSLLKVADDENSSPKTSTPLKTIEITIPPNADSTSSNQTSTNNPNAKDLENKKQKTKTDSESMVGRVGVCAFARIPISPTREQSKQNDNNVEIKTEPMEYEEADLVAKMDLMNAFKLRPVNPASMNNLRDVRINKVVTAPPKKTSTKPQEVRPRAKKTFPQPKKADEGRLELNSKNSMVYIPIQPPMTQAPVPRSKVTTSTNNTNTPPVPRLTSIANNVVNTVAPPLLPIQKTSLSTSSAVPPQPPNIIGPNIHQNALLPNIVQRPLEEESNVSQLSSIGPPSMCAGPVVGYVPTTVHTVPLLTSVNGQWTFSLQPVMSVGAADASSSPPLVNGLPERGNLLTPPFVLPSGAPIPGAPIPNASGAPTLSAAVSCVPIPGASVHVAPISGAPIPSLTIPATFISDTPSTSAPISSTAAPSALIAGAPTNSNSVQATSIPDASIPPTSVVEFIRPLITAVTPATNTPITTTSHNNPPGEPPRLVQRPTLVHPFDSSTPIGALPPPSIAGPLTAKLNLNAVKLTDFFRTLLEDSISKLDEPTSQLAALKLQFEKEKWTHEQEVKELKHNHELLMVELRTAFDKEKARAVGEVRRAAQIELEAAVKHAKSKQWCANCSQEAQFYCCWNTSYCDYPCQRAHWAQHFAICTQPRAQDGGNGNVPSSSPPVNSLQPSPENTITNSSAPTLTVGNKKTTPGRCEPPSKTSIIVSMVEDPSGNQTMKCVGTYKPTTQLSQSVLINKQMLNPEESNKVVTSGGYLIVGSSGSNTVMTPARRPHVQYFT